ncbi:MAG: class I SAM-dependent methyltransferase [Candidatus Binatia bacterium]
MAESQLDTSWQATWGDQEFIKRWANKGWQAPIREVQVAMVLRMIPQPIDAPTRVLDIGAGFGALAGAVLRDRPNATAVCLDASEAMLKLGAEKNSDLKGRISFVQGSLETDDWLKSVQGTFDAVISSRALHHFTENQRRRYIFKEVFNLERAGGCFINADNVRGKTKSLTERYRRAREDYLDLIIRQSSGGKTNLAEVKTATPSSYHGPHNNGYLAEELAWLKEAGFVDVDCFWKFTTIVVYGGFKD